MKKIIVSLTIAFCAISLMGTGFAQKKAVNSAMKSLNSSKLDQAVEDINQAIINPETMSLSSTWIVRGDVYSAVAINPYFARKYEGSADSAFESYKKAAELDPSEKTQISLTLKMPKLSGAYYDLGAEAFQTGNYELATNFFEKSFEVSKMSGVIDSASMFNIALCAANSGDLEKAVKNYEALVGGNYPLMGIYNGLADVYARMGRKEDASKLMDLLLERFESDSTAYTTAVGVTLSIGDNEHAERILLKSIEKWPTSPFLYLAMGVAYENSDQGDKAEKAYQKALELDPDYVEAVYNLGAFYVNKGIKVKNEADKLPLEETDKYDELSKEANELFQRSIPYLEKITSTQPENVNAWSTLRSIYIQLKQMDKAKAIKEKMDALSAPAPAAE